MRRRLASAAFRRWGVAAVAWLAVVVVIGLIVLSSPAIRLGRSDALAAPDIAPSRWAIGASANQVAHRVGQRFDLLPLFYLSFTAPYPLEAAYWPQDSRQRYSRLVARGAPSRGTAQFVKVEDDVIRQTLSESPNARQVLEQLVARNLTDPLPSGWQDELPAGAPQGGWQQWAQSRAKLAESIQGSWLPRLFYAGGECRFHQALLAVLGISGVKGQPTPPEWARLWAHLGFTLLLSSLSVAVAYPAGVALGRWWFRSPSAVVGKLLRQATLLLYAAPVVWMGVLLLMVFANPYALNWFPAGDLPPSGNLLSWVRHLTLPVVLVSYTDLIFLAHFTHQSLTFAATPGRLVALKARGLPWALQVSRYFWPLGRLPLVPQFSRILPALVSGTLVVEALFNLPGMGWLLLDAAQTGDALLLWAIFGLTGLALQLAGLVMDGLYLRFDPRIRLASA